MLLWMEGFDWLASGTQGTTLSDELGKYYPFVDVGSAASDGIQNSRHAKGLQFGAGHFFFTPKLKPTGAGSEKTGVVGFYIKTPSSFSTGGPNIVAVRSQDDVQLVASLNSDGTITVKRGVTALGTSTYAFSANNEYYVEMKFLIDPTVGTFEMKVADITANGDTAAPQSEYSLTGQNTENVGSFSSGWDQIVFNHWTVSGAIIDDIYILDGSGSDNNDYLGNMIVQVLNPVAEGANSDFTPSTGTDNSALVDEIGPSDGDTSYVESLLNGDTDTYGLSSPGQSLGTIAGLMVSADVRVTDARPRVLRLPVKSGATTSEGSDSYVGTDTFRGRTRVVEQDPNTSSPWTSISGVEVGIKRQG